MNIVNMMESVMGGNTGSKIVKGLVILAILYGIYRLYSYYKAKQALPTVSAGGTSTGAGPSPPSVPASTTPVAVVVAAPSTNPGYVLQPDQVWNTTPAGGYTCPKATGSTKSPNWCSFAKDTDAYNYCTSDSNCIGVMQAGGSKLYYAVTAVTVPKAGSSGTNAFYKKS